MITRLRILAAYIVVMGYFALPARAEPTPQCAQLLDDEYHPVSNQTSATYSLWWVEEEGSHYIGHYNLVCPFPDICGWDVLQLDPCPTQ
jgi:hypothetical protein